MRDLRKLGEAVLIHALKDARKGCPEARRWLLQDDLAFPMWCAALGLDPTRVRRRVKSVLEEAPLSLERRRELVIEALRENPELSNLEIGRRLDVGYETVRQLRLKMQNNQVVLSS